MSSLNMAAAAASPASAAEPVSQYLTFVLSTEVFAMGILAIKEIIEQLDSTTVPMTPELRGSIWSCTGSRCWI